MMRLVKLILGLFVIVVLAIAVLAAFTLLEPRPQDTTEASVFDGNAHDVNYCDLSDLNGEGALADDIPKAYTPGCGWEEFPMPVLNRCTEPLSLGTPDMRGLWQSYEGLAGHIELIEQCGDRVVVVSAGIIHDFRTDDTLKNGADDIIGGGDCKRMHAAVRVEDSALKFRPYGLPFTLVTRQFDGDDLVWDYPSVGTVRMKRICRLPQDK